MDGPTATPNAAATFVIVRPPPPFPAPPRSVDLSALEFILGLIAVISIPALIYTFFFAIKCPPDPFRSRRHASAGDGELSSAASAVEAPSPPAAASEVKYSKEIHAKDLGGECPVCLSAFGDGDEVKKLSACGHAFHAPCVDTWLSAHPNCPVCRASVAAAPKPGGGASNNSNGGGGNNNNRNSNQRSGRTREDDFHQGLPDASNLV